MFALALVLALAAPLQTSRAWGADAPDAGADPSPIVPPRLLSQDPPLYPEGETASASVLVELVVQDDGSASELRVVSGAEPFASAALAAVKTYRFEPARRGDRPIRARIRMEVAFTPPPPPEPVEEPVTPTPGDGSQTRKPLTKSSAAPAPPPIVIEEIDVHGTRRPLRSATEHRVGRAEIRMVPGAFGDPFRAIDMLPGVIPIVSGLPYYFVRGAPPSAVGYFVEEVRVPYLFHFGLGPGVVQPALIEEVSLHPAAFPARYGRYAGAIVAGQLREPATELRGEAQIRLYDAGAYVEAPFAGGRGAAGIGGRYSYTAGLLSLFAPQITLDYRDYNARVAYALNDEWRLSAFALGAFDYASTEERGVELVVFASEFHRLDLRLDRQTGKSSSRIGLTLGLDRTRLEDARFAQMGLVGVRGRHRVHLNADFDVEIGADGSADLYAGDLPSKYAVSKSVYDQAFEFFAPRTDTSTGAWLSASYHPTKGFDLTGTLRGDIFTSAGKVAFGPSPRVSMRVPLKEGLAFVGALGVAPQPPVFAIPVPAVGYRGLPGGLAFGYQKSAGLEAELPLKFTLRAVGFHHTYMNLRDFTRDRSNFDISNVDPPRGGPAQGYGLETFLHRKLSERFGAFMSYTLSRTELGATNTDVARIAPFDRTHVFQVGGAASLGREWRASARLLTYTGWPKQQDDVEQEDARSGAQDSGPAAGRLPTFVRIDLRIEKRWPIRKSGYIAFVMEGLNVTGTRDVVSRRCAGGLGCRDIFFGPVIVPSIGVEGSL